MAPINNHAPGQGRGATHGVALHRVSIACHAGEQGGWWGLRLPYTVRIRHGHAHTMWNIYGYRKKTYMYKYLRIHRFMHTYKYIER